MDVFVAVAGLPDFQKYATLRGPAPCTRWVAAVGGCFDSASAKTAVSARLAPTCRVRGGPQDPTHSVEGPVGPCLPDPVTHPQKPESVLGWGGRPQNTVLDVTGDLDMVSDFVFEFGSHCFLILCSIYVPNYFSFAAWIDLRPRPRRRGRRSNQAKARKINGNTNRTQHQNTTGT